MALEMQARQAPRASPSRYGLLGQAQEHYRVAAEIARREDILIASSVRVASPSPSDKSASTDDSPPSTPTRVDTPLSSAGSIEDSPSGSRKSKKRVTFRDVPIMEPIIRPDSPTLGFDDWLGRSSPEPICPEPILKHVHKMSEQVQSLPLDEAPELVQEVQSCHETFGPQYYTVLASIRCQIEKHMAMLDGELAEQGEASTLRNADIGTRIERLRACGWRRRRFDATRYRNLCENVLAELSS